MQMRTANPNHFWASPTTKHFRASPGETNALWDFVHSCWAKPPNAWVLLGEAPKSVRGICLASKCPASSDHLWPGFQKMQPGTLRYVFSLALSIGLGRCSGLGCFLFWN